MFLARTRRSSESHRVGPTHRHRALQPMCERLEGRTLLTQGLNEAAYWVGHWQVNADDHLEVFQLAPHKAEWGALLMVYSRDVSAPFDPNAHDKYFDFNIDPKLNPDLSKITGTVVSTDTGTPQKVGTFTLIANKPYDNKGGPATFSGSFIVNGAKQSISGTYLYEHEQSGWASGQTLFRMLPIESGTGGGGGEKGSIDDIDDPTLTAVKLGEFNLWGGLWDITGATGVLPREISLQEGHLPTGKLAVKGPFTLNGKPGRLLGAPTGLTVSGKLFVPGKGLGTFSFTMDHTFKHFDGTVTFGKKAQNLSGQLVEPSALTSWMSVTMTASQTTVKPGGSVDITVKIKSTGTAAVHAGKSWVRITLPYFGVADVAILRKDAGVGKTRSGFVPAGVGFIVDAGLKAFGPDRNLATLTIRVRVSKESKDSLVGSLGVSARVNDSHAPSAFLPSRDQYPAVKDIPFETNGAATSITVNIDRSTNGK